MLHTEEKIDSEQLGNHMVDASINRVRLATENQLIYHLIYATIEKGSDHFHLKKYIQFTIIA